jgi:hypothetical protein
MSGIPQWAIDSFLFGFEQEAEEIVECTAPQWAIEEFMENKQEPREVDSISDTWQLVEKEPCLTCDASD